eukprot:COSAG02_NODE_5136_length_4597_cov_2.811027_5_plen_146_part_00
MLQREQSHRRSRGCGETAAAVAAAGACACVSYGLSWLRYSDLRSLRLLGLWLYTEFQSTILSRFDAIFIVLDERNEEKDTNLSKYVMSMHAKAAAPQNQGRSVDASNAPINVATLKRYITYCRTKCSPVRIWLYSHTFSSQLRWC